MVDTKINDLPICDYEKCNQYGCQRSPGHQCLQEYRGAISNGPAPWERNSQILANQNWSDDSDDNERLLDTIKVIATVCNNANIPPIEAIKLIMGLSQTLLKFYARD